jgi:hypothetical protein
VVVCKLWVRTIDERFSGRTARTFYVGYVGAIHPKQACGLTCSPRPQPSRPPRTRPMTHAPSSGMAGSRERVRDRVFRLIHEFTLLPCSGGTATGFTPTDYTCPA